MPKVKKNVGAQKKSRRMMLRKARKTESEEEIVSDRDTDPKDVTDVSSVDEDQYSDASLLIESDTETDHIQKEKVLTGRRVVDIQYFLSALKSLQHMGFGCSFLKAEVISEKIEGFESVLTFKCNMCGKVDVIRTGDTNSSFGSANRASVVGGLSIGIGYPQLAQLFAAMDIPQMSNGTYLKHHNGISKWVTNLNQHLMSVASKEETELADEKNEDGIPIIAVIADGAWGKRSYRRNYSALSGVASIIGAKSKKNLYMGVKNKYCYLCTRGRDVSDHTCFRNWNKTSTSMEAGIICEGFSDSISRHNLIYGQLIGDGDSSVYRHLTELAPYGPTFYIRKIECRNHLLRNYINKLSDLSKNSSFPKSRRDYVCNLSTLGRFRNAVVKAVQYRKHENLPIDTKIENLRRDVLNSPFHILGRHERCQEYFCSGKEDDEVRNDKFK
ncbi:hypothetical protein RN001_008361 [Aquatica leii]|uniref:Mutator-like transposase domain-containing protein n=1 Tax=Aquatica leii TaxID=1421715 RepID=A0AAN7SRB7_9COLE|nr:hypothetical protein RN001_008361 [Aquatica leii]